MFGIVGGMTEEVAISTEVPREQLEAQICEGAAHLAAGMGRWLLLVGEFDRRKGYERWECTSAAFWLNWQCGISAPRQGDFEGPKRFRGTAWRQGRDGDGTR